MSTSVQSQRRGNHRNYSSAFDDIETFFKILGVLIRILALDQDLDRYFAPFEGLQMFSYAV